MRITLVCPFDPNPPAARTSGAHVGGVERVFDQISKRLAQRGHEVTVVCSTDGPPESAIEDGVRIIREPRQMTVFRAPVANLHRRIPTDSDIVHVAATYPFTTPKALRRAKDLGIPSVLDFHFEPAPGTLLGRLAASAYRWIGPRSYNLADAVLVRSVSYGRAAPSLRHVSERKWRVIPNGVDTTRFRPDLGTPTGAYLLFVGRLVPYKGLSVLLQAMSRLEPSPPLLVVGDGPLRPQLEAMTHALDVNVRFLGYVPEERLADLYRGARLTVLPSVTGQEAFGIALAESMACGTPVVASSLPGVEDLARLGGLLAPPGDPDALATQMWLALQDRHLARGPELAARIHATYSWDAVTDRLLEIYNEVLGHDEDPAPEVTRVADPRSQSVL